MESENGGPLGPVAETYVKLVLSVGRHDGDYVDAYYGPPEWREAVGSESLSRIVERAKTALRAIDEVPADHEDELSGLRRSYLSTQLGSLIARVEMLDGKRLTFDEESKALYDAVAPTHTDEHFQAILDELDGLLPGDGPLVDRYDAFRKEFVIPVDRLDAVFQAAIDACRGRSLHHLDLPAEESFDVEYVTDKSWGAYNWYKGGYHSVIQVNTDLPIYIDRAVDLACHEGYPGHHVYNVLLERHLVRDRGWVEFSVYPLFSPQSLIAEGTANYGIEVAFPGDERTAFERETLFPLAGIDPDRVDHYYGVQKQIERLGYAGNEAARRYLDGAIDAGEATEWLARYALMPRNRAEQRVRFIDQYRSYVINYNYGKDLVREYLESVTANDPARTWQEFGRLLSSPRLPSGLE